MLNQQLILGSTYRVKFKGVFERHGLCTTAGYTCLHAGNGVFRLEQISTFRDIVLAGIKLYDNFFAPLNISRDEYDAYFDDKPATEYTPEYTTKMVTSTETKREAVTDPSTGVGAKIVEHQIVTGREVFVETGRSLIKKHATDSVKYGHYPIYKFVDVIDSSDVVYAPELTIDGFPEIDINEYRDLSLVFRIGLYDKPEQLDPMLLSIRERLATYGIRPSSIKLYSTGSKWLNKAQYEDLKSLRLPAEIGTIPADADPNDYAGQTVIINGLVKEIVGTVAPGNESTEVAFDSIKSGNIVVDPFTFIEDVVPGDTFDTAKTYYEVLEHYDVKNDKFLSTGGYTVYRKLRDDEVHAGQQIIAPVEQGATKQAPYYVKVVGDYVGIGRDEARDAARAYGSNTSGDTSDYMAGVTEDWELKQSVDWYYWVKATKIVDNGAVMRTYRPATAADIANKEVPLYKKLVDTYRPCSEAEATHTSTGNKRYVCENYLSYAALSYIGNKFVYRNSNEQEKEITLQLVDLIDFGMSTQRTNATLILDGELNTSTNEPDDILRSRWTRWAGRAMNVHSAIDLGQKEGELVALMLRIPDDPTNDFLGKQGDILGQNGTLTKELYFTSDTSSKRNYYLQYVLKNSELEQLKHRCAALEDYIRITANKK